MSSKEHNKKNEKKLLRISKMTKVIKQKVKKTPSQLGLTLLTRF